MKQKLRVIFGDFLHTLHQFWLEVIGGVFLAFGIIFSLAAFRDYQKYVSTPGSSAGRLALEAIFSGLMLIFALDSFRKARKPR